MRPWRAVWRGKRWSYRTGAHFGRLPPTRAAIQRLEDRRLFSAALTGSFAGALPPSLPAEGKTGINVRVTNEGDSPAAGSFSVDLYASTDSGLDAGDRLLA